MPFNLAVVLLKDTIRQFSAGDICNNVHSQSRRMVMVSPECDFWIHAVSPDSMRFLKRFNNELF